MFKHISCRQKECEKIWYYSHYIWLSVLDWWSFKFFFFSHFPDDRSVKSLIALIIKRKHFVLFKRKPDFQSSSLRQWGPRTRACVENWPCQTARPTGRCPGRGSCSGIKAQRRKQSGQQGQHRARRVFGGEGVVRKGPGVKLEQATALIHTQ